MAKNTIKLKNYSNHIEELNAAGTITPGMLIEMATATTVRAHNVVGGNQIPMFAFEDELQGKGIDDNYTVNQPVQCWIPFRGDIVYALLNDGEDAEAGELLVSAGNGKLKVYVPEVIDESWGASSAQAANSIDLTVHPLAIVGVALEDVDMSGSAGVDPSGRIRVRIC